MKYNEVQKLCEKWAGNPGIVRGIMAAWRDDPSVPASEKGQAQLSIMDIFDDVFGGRSKC